MLIIRSDSEFRSIVMLSLVLNPVLFVILEDVSGGLSLPVIICGLWLAFILVFWLGGGREFTMDRQGCTVRFLWFRRFYRWSELEMKCMDDYSSIKLRSEPWLTGASFAPKVMNRPRWMSPFDYFMLVPRFGYIFVNFEHPQQEPLLTMRGKIPQVYVVDGTVFRLCMEQ